MTFTDIVNKWSNDNGRAPIKEIIGSLLSIIRCLKAEGFTKDQFDQTLLDSITNALIKPEVTPSLRSKFNIYLIYILDILMKDEMESQSKTVPQEKPVVINGDNKIDDGLTLDDIPKHEFRKKTLDIDFLKELEDLDE